MGRAGCCTLSLSQVQREIRTKVWLVFFTHALWHPHLPCVELHASNQWNKYKHRSLQVGKIAIPASTHYDK
ncbi:unnamed protein product, partial [Dovyalis caffra]